MVKRLFRVDSVKMAGSTLRVVWVLRGKVLKKSGKPVGFPVDNSVDSVDNWQEWLRFCGKMADSLWKNGHFYVKACG